MSPRTEVLTILGMVGCIAIPAILTLRTILQPGQLVVSHPNPTPGGYTMSLLLFIVPVVAVGIWHLWHPAHVVHRKALIAAALVIAGLGTFLDFFFGYAFFVFPNQGATLGVRVPAWSWSEWRWIPDYLPLEEFGFYIFGGLFMITVYLWAERNWLPDYDPEEYEAVARREHKLLELSPLALVAAALLIGAAWLYKNYGGHGHATGFPGYFAFLVLLGLLPTSICYRGVRDFINWRAFTFTFFILLLISLIWEATLGVPYGWWGYQHEYMVGIYIGAWSGLPAEAVLVWLVAAWGSTIAYEFWRVFFHMDRTLWEALFGLREPDA